MEVEPIKLYNQHLLFSKSFNYKLEDSEITKDETKRLDTLNSIDDISQNDNNEQLNSNNQKSLKAILQNAKYMKLPNIKSKSVNEAEAEGDEDFELGMKYNFNVSNKKYIPPTFARKSYLVPKVISSSLSIRCGNPPRFINALEYGIGETVKYWSLNPRSVQYDRLCSSLPPYISPVLIGVLSELDRHIPPIIRIAGGSSKATIEKADSLFSVLLRVNIREQITPTIHNIYLHGVEPRVLTNTLMLFLQRVNYPLFLATREFCDIVLSNTYRLEFTQFGCIDMSNPSPLLQSLSKSLALSSNFQVANLAYFIERCQRWFRANIHYELTRKPKGSAEAIFEESVATIAVLFGRSVVGIPRNYVASKIIHQALPVIDDIRNTIFYFLLGIPPFEFWHMWSINSLCFEDSALKSSSQRGAFLKVPQNNYQYETLPAI